MRYDFQIVIAIAKQKIRPIIPDTVPGVLKEQITKCTEHDQKDRCSAEELSKALDRISFAEIQE
jgi:hypothetical protein